MSIKGIDVSSYQGTIDWGKVASAGVGFAILKVIKKSLDPDTQFENNWKGASKAGIPIQGVYNYTYATSVSKAKSDAEKVLEILDGRKPFVWLDVEDSSLSELGHTIIDIINGYGMVITNAGLGFGVYMNKNWYETYIEPYSSEIQYPFWIARYPSSSSMKFGESASEKYKPEINHDLYGWQFSSKGQVNGISGNVDLDELYVAVESNNLVETVDGSESTELYHVGDEITVSSYYASSTDPISKAIIKNNSGTIMKIKSGTHNPYCFGKNGVAIGWCNDGDIRSSSPSNSTSSGTVTYTVKSGDTLTKIASKYGTTVNKLAEANGIKNVDFILVGQVLTIV